MKRIFLIIASLLLSIFFFVGCGVPKEEYNKVKNDLEAAQIELSQETQELTRRNTEVERLKGEFIYLQNQYNDLQGEFTYLQNQYSNLQGELTYLQNQYNNLQNEHQELLAEYTDTKLKYANILEELEQSLKIPYVVISGREITCAWKDRGGELHKWTWSVDHYRAWIENPKPSETVRLNCGGTVYTMRNLVPYVRTESFSKVISSFYKECASERVFAQEMFNLVIQLTAYSTEIGEVPRWPVETLTEAGGDCEDLAILFASLLKAAPYPYKLSLVYMDSNNPTDPQNPNHVVVWVEACDWKSFVDCTSDQGWNYYTEVVGWYYKL